MFVDTHVGIIDLTTDKKHLHTVVPCFSGGSWWIEVVSGIPCYAPCRFWRRKRGGVMYPLLCHLLLLAEETRWWWVGRRGVAICHVYCDHYVGRDDVILLCVSLVAGSMHRYVGGIRLP
jgi:hypothetical protein